jgi:hypothetical protein
VVYTKDEKFGNDTIVNFAIDATTTADLGPFPGSLNADKLNFTAFGGDMMATAVLNLAPGSVDTAGRTAYNFVNASTRVATDLKDAGVTNGYGNLDKFITQTTTPNTANTANYYAEPTAGKNAEVIFATTDAAKKDKSIVIVDLDEQFGSEGSINNEAAEVAKYVEGGTETSVSTHVVVVVDKHNVGSVYAVVDGAANNDAVATLMGTIDLGDTLWSSLTAENFV